MIKFWRHPFVWMCLKWHDYCPKHLRKYEDGFYEVKYCGVCETEKENRYIEKGNKAEEKRMACFRRAQSLQRKDS